MVDDVHALPDVVIIMRDGAATRTWVACTWGNIGDPVAVVEDILTSALHKFREQHGRRLN
jgi:hypothetical protein